MKLAFAALLGIGILLLSIGVGVAGNFIYDPFIVYDTDDPVERYEPLCKYPDGDEPDLIYHSPYSYDTEKDIYYIEYSYVWYLSGEHGPDTERVRVYVDEDGNISHLSLNVHWKWTDVYDFKSYDTHPIVEFTSVYHTPKVSTLSYLQLGIERVLPIILFVVIGLLCIIYAVLRLW